MLEPKKNITALKPYVAGRSIESVQEMYNLKKVIKLGSNENPLGASPKAIKAIQDELSNIAVYPDGSCSELRSKLADYYGVEPSWVLPGNGSDEILLMIAAAFIRPGDRVLVSENTFSQYETVSRIFDAKVEKIAQVDHFYDLDAFARQAKKDVRALFLCNPNNPTGTAFTHSAFMGFMEKVPSSCLVIVDEAYGEFASQEKFPQSILALKEYPNLVVCRTFSKLYGLASLRVGYAVATEGVISSLQRVQNFNPFNVNRLAQVAAVAALEDDAFRNKTLEMVKKGRVYLEEKLAELKLDVLPSEANFICFRTNQPALDVAEGLAKQGVIIRPLKSFGMEQWSRVTVGTEAQNQEFYARLCEFL